MLIFSTGSAKNDYGPINFKETANMAVSLFMAKKKRLLITGGEKGDNLEN